MLNYDRIIKYKLCTTVYSILFWIWIKNLLLRAYERRFPYSIIFINEWIRPNLMWNEAIMSETLLAELQNDEITIIDQTPLRPLSVNLRELLPPSSDLRPPSTLKKNRFNNLNLIRVDDTPSPILSRKFKSKNAKKKAKSTTKKSQTPKRVLNINFWINLKSIINLCLLAS